MGAPLCPEILINSERVNPSCHLSHCGCSLSLVLPPTMMPDSHQSQAEARLLFLKVQNCELKKYIHFLCKVSRLQYFVIVENILIYASKN